MQIFASQDINWWLWLVWITCELLWCFYQLFGLLSVGLLFLKELTLSCPLLHACICFRLTREPPWDPHCIVSVMLAPVKSLLTVYRFVSLAIAAVAAFKVTQRTLNSNWQVLFWSIRQRKHPADISHKMWWDRWRGFCNRSDFCGTSLRTQKQWKRWSAYKSDMMIMVRFDAGALCYK